MPDAQTLELQRQGFAVSRVNGGKLLKHDGHGLQANGKSVEGKQHPDDNAQFEFIAKRVIRKSRN